MNVNAAVSMQLLPMAQICPIAVPAEPTIFLTIYLI
jgi:hypothetical protein